MCDWMIQICRQWSLFSSFHLPAIQMAHIHKTVLNRNWDILLYSILFIMEYKFSRPEQKRRGEKKKKNRTKIKNYITWQIIPGILRWYSYKYVIQHCNHYYYYLRVCSHFNITHTHTDIYATTPFSGGVPGGDSTLYKL